MLSQSAEHELHRIEAESKRLSTAIKINSLYSYKEVVYLCLASHIKAMKEGVKSGSPFFWIAEDDVILPSPSDLNLLLKEKPEDAEVIQCCAISNYAVHRGKEELKRGNLFFEWVNGYKSTAFYGVTKEGALKFISKYGSLDFSTVQNVHADYIIYNELNTYTTSYPFAVTNNDFESDITKQIREGFTAPILAAIDFQKKGRVLVDLHKLKGQKVYFILNIGNAGDALINQSTLDYFNHINLEYEIIHRHEAHRLKGQVIIYGGGGSLVSYYSHCSRVLEQILQDNQVILLPCTVEGHEELLKSASSDLTIYCREEVSYNYIKEVNRNIDVFLSEDMAFLYNSNVTTEANSKEVLEVYRGDIEGFDKGVKNDISISLNHSTWWSNSNCEEVVTSFFNYINEYKEIHTNRLHVAIAAALLKKKVTLIEGSYYKNRAVFEFSLSNHPKIKMTNGYKKSNSTNNC